MFLMSSQTLAMKKKLLTVQLLASPGTNKNCLAVIGIETIKVSISVIANSLIQHGVLFTRKS